MMWLQKAVQRSAYPRAEIHLTEWSSSPSSRDCTHDYLQEAAFIVKCNLDGIGLADSLSYWTFTDVFEENGAGDSIFHGGFGLINYQGIVKPGFHAYRMLAKLGDTLLYRDDHAFFTKKEGKLAAILYHYPISSTVSMSPYPDRGKAQEELEMGKPFTVSYTITGLTPKASIQIEILDREHGWALPLWQRMGSPEPPSREETRQLAEKANATKKEHVNADDQGCLQLNILMNPWSIVSVSEIDHHM